MLSNGRSIAVTGASGLLGGAVAAAFARHGRRVIALYNSSPELLQVGPDVERARCDLSDRKALLDLAQKHAFDAIIHAGALTDVDRCERDPGAAFRANVIATRNVAEAARTHGARLVYVSTSSVFDGKHGNDREDDAPRPCNYYSWTKLLGEEAALGLANSLVVRATILGLHPRRAQAKNFVEWLMHQLRENLDTRLFTDVLINPITAATLSNVIIQLERRRELSGVLHVGTTDTCSKADIGSFLQARFFPNFSGKLSYVASDAEPQAAVRPKQMWINVDRIQAMGIAMPTVQGELAALAGQLEGS